MECRPRVCAFIAVALFGSSVLRAQSASVSEKSWPQQFTLESGDRVSYGVIVGMPGSITVNVTASGLVAVALYKPNGSQARTVQGAGALRLDYAATKEDISAGEAWRVILADPTGARRPAAAAVSGTIAVAHPPGDVRKVKLPTGRKPAAIIAASADPDPSLQAYRAARDAAQSAARAQRARLLQQKVSAAAVAATQAGAVPNAPRGAASAATAAGTARAGAATSTSQSASTGTGSTGGGAAPVGSNQPASTVPPLTVASLDTSGGSPGDQVFVTGSGFTPGAGLEAHFVIGTSKDVVGTVTYYNDKQIMVQVPTQQGVPSYAGKFYLRRGTINSNLVSFRFDPAMDYAVLPVTSDRQLGGFAIGVDLVEDHFIGHIPEWFTCKDDDEFFLHTTLANGWVIDSAYVRQQNHGGLGPWLDGSPQVKGDAYVSVWNRGSSSPRIKVHWWCEDDFFAPMAPEVRYWPVVIIRGPKGLPWK